MSNNGKRHIKDGVQSGLSGDDEQMHFISIDFISAIHDQNLMVELQYFF